MHVPKEILDTRAALGAPMDDAARRVIDARFVVEHARIGASRSCAAA